MKDTIKCKAVSSLMSVRNKEFASKNTVSFYLTKNKILSSVPTNKETDDKKAPEKNSK